LSNGTEFRGKSVEAAITEAEQQLGKTRDQLEVEILSQGSRGVFGLGGEPARIVVRDPSTVEVVAPPETVQPDNVPATAEAERHAQPRRRERPRRAPQEDRIEDNGAGARSAPERVEGEIPAIDASEMARSAKEVTEGLLSRMGFDAEVSIRSEDPVTLDVTGENLGILIGRRGDSLASFQFMVNVMLSKKFQTWPRVVIDVQGYRTRREQSLSGLSQRVADRVRRNRRPFTLEAMPANDRRIIHLSLRERTDVETYSIGEGASRRVVVAPKR
jgi:spoIIIJ-associated protein